MAKASCCRKKGRAVLARPSTRASTRCERLELHDRAELEHAPDENRLRLIVRRGAVVQPAYRVHGRPIERIEDVNLRLEAEALPFECLAHVQIQLVDAIAELGICLLYTSPSPRDS